MSTLKQPLANKSPPVIKKAKVRETNVIEVVGLYPDKPHSFTVTRTANSKAGIMVEFLPAEKVIGDVEMLCNALNEELMSGATLAFNDVENNFFLYKVTEFDSLQDFLHCLACDCDILMPLCKSIGEQGRWNWHVIQLARAVPQEMHRWMQ